MGYKRLIRETYKRMARDHVTMGPIVLPAKHLRLGGKEFKDDHFFLTSARAEARRLRERCGLSNGGAVLDIGCGVGRLPIGLLAEFGETTNYTGIDVDPSCVQWCQRHIQHDHPGFVFERVDVRNSRYNPNGTALNGTFRFPWEHKSFDVIYLYSVFSHMMPEDIDPYLGEFQRLLQPQGTVFLTAFVEKGVPDVMENPPDYRQKWADALHCVRYDRSFFEGLLDRHSFRVSRFDYEQETDGQSAVYLSFR